MHTSACKCICTYIASPGPPWRNHFVRHLSLSISPLFPLHMHTRFSIASGFGESVRLAGYFFSDTEMCQLHSFYQQSCTFERYHNTSSHIENYCLGIKRMSGRMRDAHSFFLASFSISLSLHLLQQTVELMASHTCTSNRSHTLKLTYFVNGMEWACDI